MYYNLLFFLKVTCCQTAIRKIRITFRKKKNLHPVFGLLSQLKIKKIKRNNAMLTSSVGPHRPAATARPAPG